MLEFTLEDAAYAATVTLRNVEPSLQPAGAR